MNKASTVYRWIISALGIFLGLWCSALFFSSLFGRPDASGQLRMFMAMFLLCILCRALPVYITEDRALDISFISTLCSLLVMGVVPAVAVIFLSTPFVVEFGPKKGDPVRHIFNIPLKKTCFNAGNLVLSVLLPGFVFVWAGGRPGAIHFPQILLPTFLFVALSLLLNAIILIRLLTFEAPGTFLRSLAQMMKLILLPNLFVVPTLGLLMATLLVMPGGLYLAVIFLVPLLLARYAFKLYLNSRQEYYQMVQVLVATIEAKDKYTEGHSKRVSQYAVEIAAAMHLSRGHIEDIRVAALLHDIGKIGINDAILNKDGVLTPQEHDQIRQHPVIGARILEHSDMDPRIRSIVLHHHERYDGLGYPDGKKGGTIPLGAFILGVADAYDAMTSDRSYRGGMPREEALEAIRQGRGKQFDPGVVDAFLSMMEQKPGAKAGAPAQKGRDV